jgi:hypothetical protein
LYNRDYSNAWWVKTASSITADAAVSPDGATNADSWVGDGTSGQHILRHGYFAITALADVVYSFYIKANGITKIGYREDGQTGRNGAFNIATKTVISVTSGDSITFEDSANGFVRVNLKTVVGSGGVLGLQLFLLDNAYTTGNPNSYSATVSASEGVYIYGGQVELGAYPTSLILTTSAAVTRLADAASKTGISSLIGQTEGTIFIEANRVNKSVNWNFLATLQNQATSSWIELLIDSNNNLVGQVLTNGINYQNIVLANLTNGVKKIALGYKLGDLILYVNGVQVGVNTSATIPALNEFTLGYSPRLSPTEYADGIAQALLFKTRLTNAQLAELTTL